MTNRRIVTLGIVVFSIALILPLVAKAQGQRAPAPPPVNLQVLPKDWTRAQVVMVMQGFNMALGVTCNYCHVEMAGAQPGANGQVPIDAAKDDKDTKKKARVMMKMVGQINSTLGSELGKPAAEVSRVQCATCHRGAAIPKVD